MQPIRHLQELNQSDTPAAGSKATALAALLRAGFHVPAGVVLTTTAYSRAIGKLAARIQARLTTAVIDDPGELEPAAAEVRQWIIDEPWDAEPSAELAAAMQRLTLAGAPLSFAARTSLPSDDLATAFGAGVERAVLGLVGPENIQHGVATCWAALWTSRSIYYRYRKKIPQTSVALGVLVQPMVCAESAGVLFTQNPMTGDPSEIQIDSIWGLGAPVTQARVYPDRFLVAKSDMTIRERQVEEKTVRLVVGADGNLEQQGVEAEQIEALSLTDAQALALAELGVKIDRFFDGRQDVEWAIAGGEIYVLQARPIALRNS
ncbi:MAG: PEP/pyruvate-binding domain-containing protein [Anaerolineae bacterium]